MKTIYPIKPSAPLNIRLVLSDRTDAKMRYHLKEALDVLVVLGHILCDPNQEPDVVIADMQSRVDVFRDVELMQSVNNNVWVIVRSDEMAERVNIDVGADNPRLRRISFNYTCGSLIGQFIVLAILYNQEVYADTKILTSPPVSEVSATAA